MAFKAFVRKAFHVVLPFLQMFRHIFSKRHISFTIKVLRMDKNVNKFILNFGIILNKGIFSTYGKLIKMSE
jgi:hypothetical protein